MARFDFFIVNSNIAFVNEFLNEGARKLWLFEVNESIQPYTTFIGSEINDIIHLLNGSDYRSEAQVLPA